MSECSTFILTLIGSAFSISLGIAEAIYVKEYENYQNGCLDIWKWFLAAAIIHIALPLVIANLKLNDKDNKNGGLIDVLNFGPPVISIFFMVTYFTVNDECKNSIQTDMPSFWTLIFVHMILAIIFIILSGLILCFLGCAFGCLLFFPKKTDEEETPASQNSIFTVISYNV